MIYGECQEPIREREGAPNSYTTSASAFETSATKGFYPYLAQPAQSYVIARVLKLFRVSQGIHAVPYMGKSF